MHIKSKGRAEGTQILCQGHGKGKARRVSTLSTPWTEVPKRDEGPASTGSSRCCRAPRSGRGPCPWTEGDVAGVCGVGSTWTPGCPAGVGARDVLLSPSSIHLAAGKRRTVLLHGANPAPGPGPTTGRVLTPQPRQLIPSHTPPPAQLDRDSGTGSGGVTTREGEAGGTEVSQEKASAVATSGVVPPRRVSKRGRGGTCPCQSLQSSRPRAGNPRTRQGSWGFGWRDLNSPRLGVFFRLNLPAL